MASGQRRLLAVLCLAEIVSWGCLYYAFPVLLPQITADTGWSGSAVSGAFSIGQLLAACAGFLVGQWVDRQGPRWVMAGGSVVGVVGLLLVAASPSLAMFFAGWFVVGMACVATLYLPAFATITQFFGRQRVRALTILTVVAGLASTVFAPITGLLVSTISWRASVVVLAGVFAAVTIPLHWWGLPSSPARTPVGGDRPATSDRPGPRQPEHLPVRQVLASRAFVSLAVAMSAGSFVVVATVVQLVPTLGEWGVDARTASVLLGLVGIGQVAGRLAYGPFAQRSGYLTQIVIVCAATALVPLLVLAPGGIAMAVVLCLLLGVARGSVTMVGATAVSERWGVRHYGALNGVVSTPVGLARAIAPWGGAALATVLGGYQPMFVAAAVVGGAATVIALASRPRGHRNDDAVPAG